MNDPESRLFTLSEAEETRAEIESSLIEAMESRRKMADLEATLLALTERIVRMGGVSIPYEKAAATRLERDRVAASLQDAIDRIHSTLVCSISQLAWTIRTCISAGASARTGFAFIIARTKVSRRANRSILAIKATAAPFNEMLLRWRQTGIAAGSPRRFLRYFARPAKNQSVPRGI